jgi:hypothetical protein
MDEVDNNPFRCAECSDNVRLIFGDYVHREGDLQLTLHEAPMWECPNCGDVHAHQASVAIATGGIQKMPRNPAEANFQHRTDVTFDHFTTVEFDIGPDDYRLLPALRRPHDEFFLTPVFFDRDVFTRYMNNPRYLVDFSSDSYGTIRNDAWVIAFGVNRSGKVIMWLGDIAELPRPEQLYLASTCVPSDHDIASDFYLGQIEAQFTGHTDEPLALQQRSCTRLGLPTDCRDASAIYHAAIDSLNSSLSKMIGACLSETAK